MSNTVESITSITNHDALVRRAEKMISDFNLYPTIPTGNLSFEFIENALNYDPFFTLRNLKKRIADMLMEQTNYQFASDDLTPILEETFEKHKTDLMRKVLNWFLNGFRQDINRLGGPYRYYMDMRPIETMFFYYAMAIYRVAKKLGDVDALFSARHALKGVELIECEYDSTPGMGLPATGNLLKLPQFREDKLLHTKVMEMIEKAICECGGEGRLLALREDEKRKENAKKKKTTIDVLVRFIMVFAIPLLCFLSMQVLDFSEFLRGDTWIIGAAMISLFVVGIVVNSRVQSLVAVVFLDLLLVALFYPVCWLIAAIALYFILIFAVVVIGFFKFTIGDKT